MTSPNQPQGALVDWATNQQPSGEELRIASEAAVEWLESHGVRVNGTRVQHLVRGLTRSDGALDARRPIPAQTIAALWDYAELHDLIVIHQQLKGVRTERFIESLRRISKGPRLLEDERADGGSIAGRNFTFELFCAARFASLGVPVGFETEADATLHIGGERLALECKRLGNIETLERNIEDAALQIRRRIEHGQAASGIAAVSISRAVHQVSIEQNVQPIGDVESLRKGLRQMVANWGPHFYERFSRLSPHLAGILIHYKLPLIDHKTGGATLLSRFTMYALDNKDSPPEVIARSRACFQALSQLDS
jgi:hypothetical protein